MSKDIGKVSLRQLNHVCREGIAALTYDQQQKFGVSRSDKINYVLSWTLFTLSYVI